MFREEDRDETVSISEAFDENGIGHYKSEAGCCSGNGNPDDKSRAKAQGAECCDRWCIRESAKGSGSGKPSDKARKTSGDLSWVHCLGAECVRGDLRIVPGLVLKNVEKEFEIEKGFSRKMRRELLFMLYARRSGCCAGGRWRRLRGSCP